MARKQYFRAQLNNSLHPRHALHHSTRLQPNPSTFYLDNASNNANHIFMLSKADTKFPTFLGSSLVLFLSASHGHAGGIWWHCAPQLYDAGHPWLFPLSCSNTSGGWPLQFYRTHSQVVVHTHIYGVKTCTA